MVGTVDMKALLQTLCILIVAVGIAIELMYRADVAYLLITVGAFAFAVATKLERKGRR